MLSAIFSFVFGTVIIINMVFRRTGHLYVFQQESGMTSTALAYRICGLARLGGASKWRLFCVKEYVNLYFGEDSGVELKLKEEMGNNFSFAFNCTGPNITPISVEQSLGLALKFFIREQWYIDTDLIPEPYYVTS